MTFQVRKVMGGWGGVVACRIILWILDLGLGFGTWISDLDSGLDLGLSIKSDN